MHHQKAVPDLELLPAFARCGTCGKPWDTGEDALQIVVDEFGEEVDLSEFVGNPLSQVRNILLHRGQQGGVLYDLSFYVSHGNSVDSFDEVDWSFPVQNGDTGLALVTRFFHPECQDDLLQE